MLDYIISKRALIDLEEIWVHSFENWSLEQADRYYNLIISEIEYICKHPYTGKSYSVIKEGYRASKVKSHLIFYKLSSTNNIEVIRILHGRMDIEQRMINK